MKRIPYILWGAAVWAAGCCPQRIVAPQTRDSIVVATATRIEYRRDTVVVQLPAERIVQIAPDTLSILETAAARSEAAILPDGRLRHTLANKPCPVAVECRTVVRDSIVWRDRVRTERVETARPLTRWQQLRLRGFWVLAAVLGLLLRREAAAIVRRFV